ncbi:acetyltransferase YpeA [mine drainage metagenome]|uniref:Acetyltransferase YpeA n=1 Tax=mine drainage metagenome TaxID=410659 RepID=A0A1J5S152_9ZZZZ
MNTPSLVPVVVVDTRAMIESDLPEACALWERTEGVELSEGDDLSELAAYLARNPGASQVAYVGDALAGAVLAGSDGRRGFLYHLAVDPSYRGRGVGRELAARALARLRESGVRRVLILVARDNPEGRAFWQRCGWEPLDFAEPMAIEP